MEIPNIPTDNLYKFMAITGIVIVIISVGTFLYSLKNLKNDILEYERKVELLSVDIEYWSNDTQALQEIFMSEFFNESDVSSDTSELNLMKSDTTYSVSVLMWDYYIKSSHFSDSNYKVALSVWQESLKKTIELRKNNINIEHYYEQIKFKKLLLFIHSLVTIIAFGLGIISAAYGFLYWYYKHQIYLDKKVQDIK